MNIVPKISLIMSVYNGEDYLVEAIESVINQTFKEWELIVINDCSNDRTGEILSEIAARDERIKVYTNEVNLKLPTSLNKAISLSSGKYIARMDSDDICLPNRLEKQFEFMEKNSDVSLSSCRFMTLKNGVYASGGCGGRCDNDALKAMLLVANPILHPGVIAKSDVMKKYNYDVTLTCTEDLELWTRMCSNGEKIEIIPECLLIYRLHDKQITSTTLERQRTEVMKIQQKYYGNLLCEMDDQQKDFYIDGIYFRTNADINKYLNYSKWLRKNAADSFDKRTINYALFEVLAEYKRRGISKSNLIKALLNFNPLFVVKEFSRRKKCSNEDVKKCFDVAFELGLKQTAGNAEFPIFEKN